MMRLSLLSRAVLPLIGALALAWFTSDLAQTLRAHTDLEITRMLFDKDVAAGASQSQNKSVPTSQPAHEWDGTVLVPDPLEYAQSYDFHEFDVLPNFDNDSMEVRVTWDAGPGIAYDLDLYVEQLVDGIWNPVGQSTNSQSADGGGAPVESLVVLNPVAGRYRTRVHNWASTQSAYHGAVSFTGDGVILKKRKVRIAGGRAYDDRPDSVLGSKVHVIYFTPSDGVDGQLDINGTLDDALEAMNLWFERETGGLRMRMDTYVEGKVARPDISFVRGQKTTAEYTATGGVFSAITTELAQRGWSASPAVKRYLVYYEGPAEQSGICGTAFFSLSNSAYAQWSVVFLDAAAGCGARDFGTPETGAGTSESIAVQEMLHNEGQTRPEAPHHCIGVLNQFHICTALVGSQLTRVNRGLDPESVDALFPYVTFRLADKRLDPGNDDYFRHPFLHRDLDSSAFWQ